MTIKDIARLSGYSLGTVSRVLNGHPNVSEKAKERVMAVIREQGFRPNDNAKHLKMQAPTSISVLVKGTQNLLFANILERIQLLLQTVGEEAYVAYLDEDADEVQFAVELCRTRRPKGLIFLGGDLECFRNGFGKIAVPAVLLTNDAHMLGFPNLSSFTTDDSAAAQEVIDYLVSCGHRSIGVLGGNFSCEQISFRRMIGIQRSMSMHKLGFELSSQYEPCRFSMDDGYEAAVRLLDRNPSVTALFALGDVIALGAMRAIYDRGLRIPEDISLIGYDGIGSTLYSYPRLSTVAQNSELLAEKGVHALLQRIYGKAPPVHEIIPFKLLCRESVLTLNADPIST